HRAGIGPSHFRDLLPPRHALSFLHQDLVVVRIGAEIDAVVLYDDELAIATQSGAAVHHFACGGSRHGLARTARDIDALRPFRELLDDLARGRPDPVEAIALAGRASRRGTGLRHTLAGSLSRRNVAG